MYLSLRTRPPAFALVSALAIAALALYVTGSQPAAARADAPGSSRPGVPAHGLYRYSLTARIHWLFISFTRPDVGSARVVRTLSPDDARAYELLIGSDPERTPLGINRWGYISETVRGTSSHVVGVMTESDEETVEAARANLQRNGGFPFKAIRATVANGEANADVVRLTFAENFTLRDVATVLARLPQVRPAARPLRVPDAASSGFLGALDDLLHASVSGWIGSRRLLNGASRTFVWDRGLHELKLQESRAAAVVTIGQRTYRDCLEGTFEIRNHATGNRTRFELTYGTRDPIAEVPVRILYGPRWWFEVELTLAGS